DLIDHGQKVVGTLASTPVDLIHADGLHSFQLTVRQTPLHKPLHRTIDHFPAGLKGLSRFPPGQAPCPTRQEAHHGQGDWALAFTPGQMLDHHPMLGTLHSSGCVDEIGGDPPQGDEEPSARGEPVIAGHWLETLRALGVDLAMGLQSDFDALRLAAMAAESDFLVNKTGKPLNSVQNGLNFELNSWSLGRGLVFLFQLTNYSSPWGSAIRFLASAAGLLPFGSSFCRT